MDKATQAREAAEAQTKAALEQVQDALVTLAVQIGDDQTLRADIIQHLYWLELDIKPTWLAEAFGLKTHQIVELAGKASMQVSCSQCGQDYRIIVTSRTDMRSRMPETNRGRDTAMICQTCTDVRHSEWRVVAERERAAQETRLQELRSMPYREYLQTAEWQARRTQQLRRAGYRCQVCNASRTQLNVHHRTYERRGNEEFKDLIVLCADCHSLFHSQGRLAQE